MDGAGRVSAHPDVTGAWHVVGAHCMFVIEMCQKTLSMAGNKLAELRRPQVPKRPRFSLPGAWGADMPGWVQRKQAITEFGGNMD